MTPRAEPVCVEIIRGLDAVSAREWDALVGEDDPFSEHAFLHALERSGSVGPGTGWDPLHVTVRRGGELVAAMPLYAKSHSYGEYIFDWAWADASSRLGVAYYPKLVSMVPVTPATGTRVLFASSVSRDEATQWIERATFELADRIEASSVHWLFLNNSEAESLTNSVRWMMRLTHQFHWHNDGYASFEDFAKQLRSSVRKNVRKERAAAQKSFDRIDVRRGDELSAREWGRIAELYRHACDKKGSYPYLRPSFFDRVRETLPHRALVVAGMKHGEIDCASLNFFKGNALFGRYWAAEEADPMVHFELCYYQLLDFAIAHGMQRVEAGAQGTHKLRRGFMPRAVHSAHWIRNSTLSAAVGDYLGRERRQAQATIESHEELGPFHRS